MRTSLIILTILVLGSCKPEISPQTQWQIVYKNNSKGEKILGNKSTLIAAARMGYPIRLGFGGRRTTDTLKSVEHIADAAFISVINGKEVFAQINAYFGQTPHLDADTLRIDLKHENKWTLLIGTNGERSTLSKHFDDSKKEESKRGNRGATWYAKLPEDFEKHQAIPIWE